MSLGVVPAELSGLLAPGGRFASWEPRAPSYVVCDIDGTLLAGELTASNAVATAVRDLRGAGVRVGLATGRARHGARDLVAQLGSDGPHIFHDGAEVADGNDIVATWHLAHSSVDALLDIARRHADAYVEIYTSDHMFVSSWDERARTHWDMLQLTPDGVLDTARHLGDAEAIKATVVVFETRATVVDALTEDVQRAGMRAGPSTSPRTPELAYINVTDPAADKGRALERAAAHLGIATQDTLALGDAANDLPMFANAGTAIAMGQAARAVHEAAHLVAPGVDDDGAAIALNAVRDWVARQGLPGAR